MRRRPTPRMRRLPMCDWPTIRISRRFFPQSLVATATWIRARNATTEIRNRAMAAAACARSSAPRRTTWGARGFWEPDRCGDGDVGATEACDDGNGTAGDGCAADCSMVEPGWTCPVPGRRCSPICGEGVITAPETCDDGNQQSGDGCSSICTLESPCVATDGTTTACPASCGNGVIDGAEQCDDGPNNADVPGSVRNELSPASLRRRRRHPTGELRSGPGQRDLHLFSHCLPGLQRRLPGGSYLRRRYRGYGRRRAVRPRCLERTTRDGR